VDVGGAISPAETFFDDDDVAAVDVGSVVLAGRRSAAARGAQLPFRDSSFHPVVSQDQLQESKVAVEALRLAMEDARRTPPKAVLLELRKLRRRWKELA
jgi:hypothetical protein